LRFISYGIDQARRVWLEKRHVPNAMLDTQLRGGSNRGAAHSLRQLEFNPGRYS